MIRTECLDYGCVLIYEAVLLFIIIQASVELGNLKIMTVFTFLALVCAM